MKLSDQFVDVQFDRVRRICWSICIAVLIAIHAISRPFQFQRNLGAVVCDCGKGQPAGNRILRREFRRIQRFVPIRWRGFQRDFTSIQPEHPMVHWQWNISGVCDRDFEIEPQSSVPVVAQNQHRSDIVDNKFLRYLNGIISQRHHRAR